MFIEGDYFKNIFNTFREAILILDENMKVLSANRSFFTIFKVDSADTIGSLLYDLGNGQWNVPALRMLLEDILPKKTTVENFTIEHNFESIGQKTMLLNVSKIRGKKNDLPIILLAIEDITERKRLEVMLTESERKRHEEELSKSEEYTRDILQAVDEGFIVIDPEYRVLAANRAYLNFIDKPSEDVIGKHCYELTHHVDKPCWEDGTTVCPVALTFKTGEHYSSIHRH